VEILKKPNVFNALVSKLATSRLICLSGDNPPHCQTCGMISPIHCAQKAQDCEAWAATATDPLLVAEWRQLGVQWRQLAADKDAQATTARLMAANCGG
jgi:hypothetical protein